MHGQSDVRVSGRPTRLLYITHASPVPAKLGPARRHYHVLDQLCRFFDVHLLSRGSTEEAALFADAFAGRVSGSTFAPPRDRAAASRAARKAFRTVTGRCDFLPPLDPTLRRQCADVTARHRFAGIVLSSVLLRSLPLPDGVPIVGDTHNVEFDVLRRTAALSDRFLRRQHARWQWPATHREERLCAHRVDLLLATSDRDRAVFEREMAVSHVAVVPNGIDLSEFSPCHSSRTRNTIVFSGLMSYFPNQQAVRWFLDHAWPIVRARVPGATFIVAGASPPRWLHARAHDGVVVTGPVPDIRPYLSRAAVIIAPLKLGGGTRVKILEALAMGQPVVSTTVGAEGLHLRHGEDALIADDAGAFAERVIEVLTDEELALRLGTTGRRHVARQFDWNVIGERMGDLVRAAVTSPPRAQASDRE